MCTKPDTSQNVLLDAKELAPGENLTVGEVMSEIAQSSLQSRNPVVAGTRNGFPLFAPTRQKITNELVKALQETAEYQ